MLNSRHSKSAALFAVIIQICLSGFVAQATTHSKPLEGVQWKNDLAAKALDTPALEEILSPGQARHVVVQLRALPDEAARNDLADAGIRLAAYLGGATYFAKIDSQADASKGAASTHIASVCLIDPSWKLHPRIAAEEWPDYASFLSVKDEGLLKADAAGNIDTVAVYLLFFPGVALEGTATKAVESHGGAVQGLIHSINGMVAWLPKDQVYALAQEDCVQWIEPPLPQLGFNNDSNRVISQVDALQEAPYGLDGSGVKVLVFDGGTAHASHEDFGGRLTVRDSSGGHDHPTHVAGTVGGSGSASGGVRRGMAPGVEIESYGLEISSSGFLYTDPCDMEQDYSEAVNTYGAELSNNSIGSNVASNGFPCSWEGDYGATAMLIDAMVRGSLGSPMRIVWSAGNENNDACGSGYHLTPPPANAKNHICVGALNSNDDSMTSFSSWGPSDDGRLKPDICAPGCQSNSDGGVTSCASTSDTAYTVMCGTSMAAPTVTGICALLLQDWKALYPGEALPYNSTLKVLLTHNAVDLGRVGPDYQFGYGSVRAQDTIDFLRSGQVLEDSLDQGETRLFFVNVGADDTELKVTLAWDDVPGAANTTPELVNDIDILLIEPGSSTEHYPWTLNPNVGEEDDPALRNQADHSNNIEQVVVDNPAPGAWVIQVSAYAIPEGPQPFSLAASPSLLTASRMGVLMLDAAVYSCESMAGITVTDMDLNTDPGSVESLTLRLISDSEAAGELITLRESDLDSPVFSSSCPLSLTDQPGILQVADGDSISVSYEDADDGSGAQVTLEDSARVDCQAPLISNVRIAELSASYAMLAFESDEMVVATVNYGDSCEDLSQSVSTTIWRTSHSLRLSSLTYYCEVKVTDPAGNALTDDNHGACYSFTTLEQPDYFTQTFFNGAVGFDFKTFFFSPNGGNDFYRVCSEDASAFPTDPSNAETLSLADDGYVRIDLSGTNRVSFFGNSYDSFYLGSNGYICFGAADASYDPNLTTHFSIPRFSGLFCDLDPSSGGRVSWQELSDRVVLSFEETPLFYSTTTNSFQYELFFDHVTPGYMTLTYQGLETPYGLVGLSEGLGVPVDYLESDFSGYGSCAPFEISPTSAFLSEGPQTGPFGPISKTYSLRNDSADTMQWTASVSVDWLDLSPASGSLASGATETFQAILNATTATLPEGSHDAVIRFTNSLDETIQSRLVTLSVGPQLLLSPETDFNAEGMEGGPFSPATMAYELTNLSGQSCNWSLSSSEEWIALEATNGVIASGESLSLSATIEAASLSAGSYSALLSFSNTSQSITRTRAVTLEVIEITGEIEVSDSIAPIDDLDLPFGAVIVGNDRTEQITIHNRHADRDLLLREIRLASALYEESFNDGIAQEWEEINDAQWEVSDGEYKSEAGILGVNIQSLYTAESFENATVQASFRRTGALSTAARLLFRAQPGFSLPNEEGNAYAIAINASGSFYVGKYIDGVFSFIQDWTDSNLLLTDGESNHVAVSMDQDAMDLYLNGVLVWSGEDSSISGAGYVGFANYSGDSLETIHFMDDMQVLPPTPRSESMSARQQWCNSHALVGGTHEIAPAGTAIPCPPALLQASTTPSIIQEKSSAFSLASLPILPFTIAPGASLSFDVNFAPSSYDAYEGKVQIETNDYDEERVEVSLSGQGRSDFLLVVPEDGFDASGFEGGPFNPAEIIYTLTNEGDSPLDWGAEASENWLDLNPASGSLSAGASILLTISLSEELNDFSKGDYSSSAVISNLDSGVSVTRSFSVEVIELTGEIALSDSIAPTDDLALPFGDVLVGNTGAAQISIENLHADRALLIEDIAISYAVYEEDFEDGAAQGWEETSDAQWVVVGGEYKSEAGILRRNIQSLYIAQTFSDATVQASFRRLGDPEAAARFLFRTQPDFAGLNSKGSAYAVGITGDGRYWVGKYLEGTFEYLQDWTDCDLLLSGSESNLVTVSMQGENIDLYFNGALAWSGVDDAITEAGYVGFRNYSGSGAEAIHYMDNIEVGPPTLRTTSISQQQQWYNAHPLSGASPETAPKDASLPSPKNLKPSVPFSGFSAEKSAPFSLGSLPTFPASLAPGATLSVDLSFAPPSATPFGGRVLIQSNDYDESEVALDLSGAGRSDYLETLPDTDFESSGLKGGPFSPEEKIYTLSNTGDSALVWTAHVSESWVDLSLSSGRLEAGASSSLTLALNSSVAEFDGGEYNATVTISNKSTGAQETRAVSLRVLQSLEISPNTDFVSSGYWGGELSPTSLSYTLSNSSSRALNWRVSMTENWLLATPSAGTLFAGTTDTVVISLDDPAWELESGTHSDTILFTNLTSGLTTERSASLEITAAPDGAFLWFPLSNDPGWTTEGQWEFGAPQGLAGDPSAGHTGSTVYGYNLNGSYGNDIPAYALTTTALDCSGYEHIELNFWRWLGVEDATFDQAAVEISIDGTNWHPLWRHTGEYIGDLSWTECTYDISDYADGQVSVYIRWLMGESDESAAFCGWNIDDVLLRGDALEGLVISPRANYESTGIMGGPFSPPDQHYSLSNPGVEVIQWAAEASEGWLDFSPSNGFLAPGANIEVAVSLNSNADALIVGEHNAVMRFTQTGDDSVQDLSALLVVLETLEVLPEAPVEAVGPVGGPFEPLDWSYSLLNNAQRNISWSIASSAPWLDYAPSSGILDGGGGTATIRCSLNENANTLAPGDYSAVVYVENYFSGGVTRKEVSLHVGPGKILYCSETCAGAPDYFSQAFANLGLDQDVWLVSEFESLSHAIDQESWDLIVIDKSATDISAEETAVLSVYSEAGGKVIFYAAGASAYDTTQLFLDAGVSASSPYSTPRTIFPWQASPLFTTPNQVPQLVADGNYCATSGYSLEIITASAMAGYEESYNAAMAAISLDPAERILMNSFVSADFSSDVDQDGKVDMVELFENELVLLGFSLNSSGEGEGEGEGEGSELPETHSGDYQDPYGDINLSELLRFIQFFNLGGYHCAQEGDISDEGYMPGSTGSLDCARHTGDYIYPAWQIDLSELLRFIQFYNSLGYYRCDDPLSDEGYCPLSE